MSRDDHYRALRAGVKEAIAFELQSPAGLEASAKMLLSRGYK